VASKVWDSSLLAFILSGWGRRYGQTTERLRLFELGISEN